MLEMIGRIGIFMIAAQAMVHFAPGKQYEKYIKSVAGIIVLVLFLQPFLRLFGVQAQDPQAVLKRLEEWIKLPDFTITETVGGADETVVERMEEEVKRLLNRDMEGEGYLVSGVSIRFEKDQEAERGSLLSMVEVRISERKGEEREGRIRVEEIVLDEEKEPSFKEICSAYRGRFAEILGIEEERVEVRADGGREKTF